MKKRIVLEILGQEMTWYRKTVPMYKLKIRVMEENGTEQTVNVLFMEEDYNMIVERGYYYC